MAEPDLTDIDLFSAWPYRDVWEPLRVATPIYWNAEQGGSGHWALTRHADIVSVLSDSETFTSELGIRLESGPAAVAAVRGRTLLVSDAPRHTLIKRAFAPMFSGRALAGMQVGVQRVADRVITAAVEVGTCDFAADVAAVVPSVVIGEIFESRADTAQELARLTSEALGAEDPGEQSRAHSELFLYSGELLDECLAGGPSPMAAALTAAVDLIGFEDVVLNIQGILLAANETTRYATAGALGVLIDHCQVIPQVLTGWDMDSTVEEILRWTCPGMHLVRTATRDVTVGGVPVSAGDRLVLWLASANFDEDVFPEAAEFRADRTPNPHLTFGSARHRCLGERLARMELAAVLRALRRSVHSAEYTGSPTPRRSNHLRGLDHMPVRLTPRHD